MKAKEMRSEDVYSDKNGMWMVREVIPKGSKTAFRLSAGRTDRGQWFEMDSEAEVNVYRSERDK